MRRLEWILLLLLAVSTGLLAMLPWWLMNPARAQSPADIDLSFALRGGWNTVFAFTSFAGAAMLALRRWLLGRGVEKLAAVFSLFLIGLSAAVANINLIGEVFQPIHARSYVQPEAANFLTPDDLLLASEQGDQIRAYPLRLLGYHHLVEDQVGSQRILATYDAFTRGAIIWKPQLDGQLMQFTLAGIENQNFLMRDEQTGSWWRQATGEAVAGSLRGRRLEELPSQVVSLAILQREHPYAEVLQPADGSVLLPSDPEAPRQGLPPPDAPPPLDPLTLVVGVRSAGDAVAVAAEEIQPSAPYRTTLGGKPVVILREGNAYRAYPARDGTEPAFAAADPAPLAVRAELWFAWKRAFPETRAEP